MSDCIIIRYGELALKGKNRVFFERRLIKNIKSCLEKNKITFSRIGRCRGRILVWTTDRCECLKKVFGITSFSPAEEKGLDLEKIKEGALKLYTQGSFRISARRLEKMFIDSQKINEEVGKYIVERKKAKVALKHADVEIGIEVFNNRAYLFNERIKGLGGLPVGVSGKVAVLLEDEKSVEAALLMMKRGCETILVKQKKVDYSKIEDYSHGTKLRIVDKIPENILAVVVSENLNNLKERKEIKKLILRPLITS